jgi:hypothetical protein
MAKKHQHQAFVVLESFTCSFLMTSLLCQGQFGAIIYIYDHTWKGTEKLFYELLTRRDSMYVFFIEFMHFCLTVPNKNEILKFTLLKKKSTLYKKKIYIVEKNVYCFLLKVTPKRKLTVFKKH